MTAQAKVVAIEEHFWTPELRVLPRTTPQQGGPRELKQDFGPRRRSWNEGLDDLGEMRLREMDEAGIELQVISHAPPAAQNLEPAASVAATRRANDTLHEAVRAHPDRFAGFAVLPTPDPAAAAEELERAVMSLGFKGAMIHGTTHRSFIDERRFWPIFERAQALDVPVYLHPAQPHPAVTEAYFKDYPFLAGAGWGYTMETATQAVRLIVSGIFDVYPGLKIILGHMGEGMPFNLWRCDAILSRDLSMKRRFRDYFCEHFWVTTSGNFSYPALLCSMLELGVDRILFSIDWPYASNLDGRRFIDGCPLSKEDKDKILRHNTACLLRL